MTTPDPTVGTTAAAGADGQPVQPVSPTPAAPIDGDAIRLLSELGGRVDSLSKELRGLQSRQDKGEKNQAGFQEQLARYQTFVDRGLKPDEAIAEMQRVDSFASWQQDISKQISDLAGRLGGIGATPTEQQMVAEVMSEYKLDPKDAFVAAQFQGKQFASRQDAELHAARVFRDKALSPNPTKAQDATAPGGSVASANNEETYARIAELSKNRTQNREEIEMLLRQVGLKT